MDQQTDFALACWDSLNVCPACKKERMMTNGTLMWCRCEHKMLAKDYDPTKINITLQVDNIVTETRGRPK